MLWQVYKYGTMSIIQISLCKLSDYKTEGMILQIIKDSETQLQELIQIWKSD